jgi:acetaldehyde dehydrogenase (acetylating)
MPAARVVVNTPATHGAIGFSTALAPSMTLGCGSWGGNVTSDNISPLHLMDIKRVAFETRPVTTSSETTTQPSLQPPMPAAPAQPQIDQAAVAALVDRFLAARKPQIEAASINPVVAEKSNGASDSMPATEPQTVTEPKPQATAQPGGSNGYRPQAVEFVCEEDVKRAIAKGEKIYINAKTIITPSARDLGNSLEVFARA